MLAQQTRGSIILIGSMCATICVRPKKQAAYNASKGAIVMLAKSLATEWRPRGTRVNSLGPGYMNTDLIKGLLEKADTWVKDLPLGRMANPIKSCFIEPCPVLVCSVAITRVI
jgi:sorbose reductase